MIPWPIRNDYMNIGHGLESNPKPLLDQQEWLMHLFWVGFDFV